METEYAFISSRLISNIVEYICFQFKGNNQINVMSTAIVLSMILRGYTVKLLVTIYEYAKT